MFLATFRKFCQNQKKKIYINFITKKTKKNVLTQSEIKEQYPNLHEFAKKSNKPEFKKENSLSNVVSMLLPKNIHIPNLI